MLPQASNVHSEVAPSFLVPSLHLLFSTNYVPPGYFARMATVISMDKSCQVALDEELFCNRISFGSPGQEIDNF